MFLRTAFIQRHWKVLMRAIHIWIQQQKHRGLVEVHDLHTLHASVCCGQAQGSERHKLQDTVLVNTTLGDIPFCGSACLLLPCLIPLNTTPRYPALEMSVYLQAEELVRFHCRGLTQNNVSTTHSCHLHCSCFLVRYASSITMPCSPTR